MRDFLYERYVSTFKGCGPSATSPASPTRSQRRAVAWYYMRHLMPASKDAAILDLGCGDGALLQCLKDEGFTNLHGVDYSREQVALAVRRGVSADHGDLFEFLERRHRTFDFIFAIDVLEHLKKNELLAFGQLVRESLSPGGTIIVQVPNGEGLFSGHVIYGDLTHQTIFNASSLRQFFQAFGLSDIRISPTGPIPLSFAGCLRWAAWKTVAGVASIAALAEAGRIPAVLTQTIVCSARLRSPLSQC